MKKICRECNNEFIARRKDVLFCSSLCRNRFNSKKNKKPKIPPQKCGWCGEEFSPKSINHRFCCLKCRKEYGNSKDNVNIQKRRCAICGNSFSPFSNANIYCSEDCKKIAAKKKSARRGVGTSDYMQFREFDFFPTKSGIAGVETCSTIFNPMG